MDDYRVRFVPLGGIVGVTKNMYLYEIYAGDELKDILIVDCGIGFPEEKEFGVDFVIPDISYLRDKKDKIRAILLTHGHEDHITALPYLYDDLGRPPLYASRLTSVFIMNKFKEFNQQPDVIRDHNDGPGVDYGKEYEFGGFRVKFIPVTHSIPDPLHILIKTPVGNFYHGPDFKFDLTPPFGSHPDFYEITKAGHEGVLCLMSDSLGAERDGLTLSEAIVGQTFEDEMRKTKGKFIMTTFSSNISRIRQCVEAAIKFNRKIVFLGRSMKENTTLAKEIGYLPIPGSLIGKEEQVMRQPPNKICLIIAGSQGQYESALGKLARKQNKNVVLKPGDKVVFSSDPVPGNESEVYAMIEELTKQGADVVYPDIQDQLHASGHGNKDDLKLLIRFTDPLYFIPIGGTVRHQRQYQRLAAELGYAEDKVFMLQEGQTVWFSRGNKAMLGDNVETRNIYVDAYGVGDVGRTVLRDRKNLSSDGMVVVILPIGANATLAARPKIVSKGFVYEKDETALFEEAAKAIEKSLSPRPGEVVNLDELKRQVEKEMEDFFFDKTGREPLIVVDTIEI